MLHTRSPFSSILSTDVINHVPGDVLCVNVINTLHVYLAVLTGNMDIRVPRHAQKIVKMLYAIRPQGSVSINAIKDITVITVTARAAVTVLATTVTLTTAPVKLKTVWSHNTPGMVRPVTQGVRDTVRTKFVIGIADIAYMDV